MGIGDALMAAGRAKLLHQETRKIYCIGDGDNVLWSPLYDHTPYLSQTPTKDWVIDYPGHRPYLESYTARHRVFDTSHRPEPAEIFWGPGEEPVSGVYAIIEPNTKPGSPLCKEWPLERYQAVVDSIDIEWIQFRTGLNLKRVNMVKTDLRQAAQFMAGAEFFVAPEGGLHHLAAAVATPGVVLFNSWHPPEITGYPMHTNLYIHDPEVMGYTKRPNRTLIEVEDVCSSLRNIRKSKKSSTVAATTGQPLSDTHH